MWFRPLLILIAALAFARASQAVDILVTAAAGQPYGVARVEIPVVAPSVGQVLPPMSVTSTDGRVLFPVSDDELINLAPLSQRAVPRPGRGRLLNRLSGLIRELARPDEQLQQTTRRRVTFLVVGPGPIQIHLSDSAGAIGTYDVVLENDPQVRTEVLQQWWSGYTQAARRQIDAADYPTAVESYLVAMLAGRLNLPLPDWYLPQAADEDLLLTLKLVAGAEGASEFAFRTAAIGARENLGQTLPLPNPPRWAPPFSQDDLAHVPVEPLATRVPPECFYIRYGAFENYLWFRDLTEEYGGDITQMLTLRGIENSAFLRMESQLNAKTTELTRMLGPTVIEDQALIGQDLFVADGASIGVLFKAKNAFLLGTSLNGDRASRAAGDDAVTLRDVDIDGRQVSLLSSADNRVRSFLASDGDYFLVTNSRTIVRRFFEVGDSSESLAATASFRLAPTTDAAGRSSNAVCVFFARDAPRSVCAKVDD